MGIRAKGLGKSLGKPPQRILSGIDLELRDGDFTALTGRSGSGKSTLMYLLSALDAPSEGAVEIDGRDPARLRPAELDAFRNRTMGFVFQFHYLLAELDALENVLLPAVKAGQARAKRGFALELLERFGLERRVRHLPRELSGGELQRVAIARALVMQPRYLFADEPTGNLDSAGGERVMEIFQETNSKLGTTILMVTHDPDFAALAARQVRLVDGRLAS